jgi:prepilin-type N-terminal cleavage/methylation domain-containing protein/prepilin-type processing-associated H-X9-DG protein
MSIDGRFQVKAAFPCGAQSTRQPPAFTLLELLVVLAIIAVLASLLLPALSRAKSQSLSAVCVNNLKQLEACCNLYALDNSDYFPPNNFVYDVNSDTAISSGASWCTNLAPFDTDPGGIEGALLFPYNTSDAIYHCPADISTIQNTNGVSLGQPRFRTYSMSQSINGVADFGTMVFDFVPSFARFGDVSQPGPSACFVFIDVHENEIRDTQFGIPTLALWPDADVWWDIPANRHNQGCNFSFADGHAEHRRWAFPKVVNVPRGNVQPVDPAEVSDFNRMQTGFRQDFD